MRASGPATRSAHAFSHFIKTDFYAAVPGLVFLGGCHPAYPLIACQWRHARPYIRDNCVRLDRFAKICRNPVHRTGSDRLSSHSSRSLQVTNPSANQAVDPVGTHVHPEGPRTAVVLGRGRRIETEVKARTCHAGRSDEDDQAKPTGNWAKSQHSIWRWRWRR